MSRHNYTEFVCDRCGNTARYTNLTQAQVDGWSQIVVLKVGAASDSLPRWDQELCPDCQTAALNWADRPVER